jgi:hypothetical protein
VGRAIERSARGRGARIARLQPIVLVAAAALVVLAVVLLVGGATGAGLVVALLALLAGGLALASPTRRGPDRDLEDRLRRRLQRAEADQARWETVVERRSRNVDDLAGELGLPARATEADVERLGAELADARQRRARLDDATRQADKARNLASAAAGRRDVLLAERFDLQADTDRLEQAWLGWCAEVGLPGWLSPPEVEARCRAAAEGHPPPHGDAASLHQARRGVVDELSRLSWELDKLALTRRLLVDGSSSNAPAAR